MNEENQHKKDHILIGILYGLDGRKLRINARRDRDWKGSELLAASSFEENQKRKKLFVKKSNKEHFKS